MSKVSMNVKVTFELPEVPVTVYPGLSELISNLKVNEKISGINIQIHIEYIISIYIITYDAQARLLRVR